MTADTPLTLDNMALAATCPATMADPSAHAMPMSGRPVGTGSASVVSWTVGVMARNWLKQVGLSR